MQFENLSQARQKILGVSQGSLARLSGLDPQRLAEIESAGVATVSEWDRIGRTLGIDPDALAECPIEVRDPLVGVLAYVEEFKDVSATTKARIIAASSAARDLAELRDILDEAATWERFQQRRGLAKPRATSKPYEQGRHYALKLRKRLAIRAHPIRSMRDFVATHFPEVTLLYADLADTKLAGVSMADDVRGPVIVLNTVGKNENHLVRRFSLAHELCHLLVDRPEGAPLAQLSGYKSDAQLQIEQRANSFATRLLCPEQAVRLAVKKYASDNARAKLLIEEYGLHYQAVRLLLFNVEGVKLPAQTPASLVGVGAKWRAREPTGLDLLPVHEIPAERRTVVAQTAAVAYARGLIRRGRFADVLGVDRTVSVDRVLDALGLEPPEA